MTPQPNEKTREQIMAEREAKKLAKQARKQKPANEPAATNTPDAAPNIDKTKSTELQSKPKAEASNSHSNDIEKPTEKSAPGAPNANPKDALPSVLNAGAEKTRDQIKAEREAKKLAKQAAKAGKKAQPSESTAKPEVAQEQKLENPAQEANTSKAPATVVAAAEEKKKPALTKAERRAIQEAQRAAKAEALAQKGKAGGTAAAAEAKSAATTVDQNADNKSNDTSSIQELSPDNDCKVKLFNHLSPANTNVGLNNPDIHPIIACLGLKYAKRVISGSNARCIAFMQAIQAVVHDFHTPSNKEFARSLETFLTGCVDYLHQCRPLAVSVSNAYKHIKHVLTQLPTDKAESELKEDLCHFINTYLENQILKAAQAINTAVQEKITDGDVILTFGSSSLITYILSEAQRRQVNFRVIVVDSRPLLEGQQMLHQLCSQRISCTYVLVNAVSYVMPEVTKVLLGAHALLSNGYVMARTGTAQVALVAHSFNVPVLVCCETHKFSERFQTDAIVYNELGDPNDLVINDKCCLANWQDKSKMSPLNLLYDVTPPELVTAVVTEVSILPCTSVPVILRIKPEIGY